MRLLLALVALLVLAAPAVRAVPDRRAAARSTTRRCSRPGRYKDTLRGGEQLFYAVSLKPGQKLTAGLTVSGRTDSSYFMKLALYNPLREKDVFDGEQTEPYGQTDRSASLRVEGKAVGEANGGTTERIYSEPGTYYISVAADDAGRQPRGGPVRHAARPPGDGPDHRRRRRRRRPRRRPKTADPGQTAGLGGGDGGGGGSGELGMAIVLGLALGGLVGFGVRRLRAA